MTFMRLHLVTSGVNTGISLGYEVPILGVGGQLWYSSERTSDVLAAALQTKFFKWVGCHLFVKENRLGISLIPVAIAITNECVPESWLDRVREINTLFQKVITGIFYASVGYRALDSIRNRNGWMAAYCVANLLGGLLSSCMENGLISSQALELATNRCKLLSLALRICASETIEEGVVVLSEVTLTPLVNFFQNQYYYSLLLSLPGLSEERLEKIAAALFLDRQRRNRIHADSLEGVVDGFDREAVKEGAQFLKELYHTLSRSDRQNFQDIGGESMEWIPLKAVYIYSFGEKKGQSIPLFFKEDTRKAIEELRKKELQPEEKELLKNFFSSIAHSSKDPDPSILHIRNQIVGAAYNETTGCMLTLACLETALLDINSGPISGETTWQSRVLSFFRSS